MNKLAGDILRKAGLVFGEWKDYDWMAKWIDDWIDDEGYADYYLCTCWNETMKINEADPSVYRQLVEIDETLGTNASTQLSCCLAWTRRWDIIKV